MQTQVKIAVRMIYNIDDRSHDYTRVIFKLGVKIAVRMVYNITIHPSLKITLA
jgi:hypothetical protein